MQKEPVIQARGGVPKGFLRFLNERALALPDRQGNQRTDSFHNIISNKQVSLVAVVPGSNELLHLSGNASITNDKSLLDTMHLKVKPPQATLLLDLKNTTITQSKAENFSLNKVCNFASGLPSFEFRESDFFKWKD
jgi:predicted pyridoxine 5'-phosphate oxidase superfamily flavin-nucleotide-binding protein